MGTSFEFKPFQSVDVVAVGVGASELHLSLSPHFKLMDLAPNLVVRVFQRDITRGAACLAKLS
jgi:hypothetical protein